MRRLKLLNLAVLASGLIVASLVGCDTFEQYAINAPEGLQEQIDSIYEANNKVTGDTINVPIIVPNVGTDDNSAAWWSEFSQYFTVPANRLLHVEFDNYGTGVNNWNNWNLCVCTGERDADGYSEYFVLRSDAYGWGNSDYSGAMIKTDYAETLESDDMWATFRNKMQGAHVYLEVDHSRTGNCYVTAKHVALDGTTFIETYEQPVSATADINAFLICDGSHFLVKKAYTITSKVQTVEDQNAVSISVSGYPEVLEVGQEDYWGNAVATVTFADGSSTTAAYEDLTFTLPDLTTAGTKTILVSYSKTKLGNYGTPVATYYNIVVNNPMSELRVVTMPNVTKYYTLNGVIAPVFTQGLEVEGVFADGSTTPLPLSALTFSSLKPEVGKQEVTISYDGGSEITTTTYPVEVLPATSIVGAIDCTTPWWTAFAQDHVVASGESYTFNLQLVSDNINNWDSPCTILRKADLSEYCVVRMDNFGWGGSYESAVSESNWNWDLFTSMLSGSEISITVTNNGNDTADILYNVVWPNGEEHFQLYKGIPVDSNDLQTALVTEASCLILHD